MSARHFLLHLVFDGRLGRALGEMLRQSSGVYGLSKAKGEALVLQNMADALIIRTSAFFGPWDQHNFAFHALSALARGEEFTACDQTFVSPTFVPDLCHMTLDLLIDGAAGIWHLANEGEVSWYEFARRIAEQAGVDHSRLRRQSGPVRLSTALASTRGAMLRPVDHAIREYVARVRYDAPLPSTIPIDARLLEAAE